MTDLVAVRVLCRSGEHPDGDSVLLRPRIGLAGGVEAQQTVQGLGPGVSSASVTGLLLEVYAKHGVAEWTLHDETGQPLELNAENLKRYVLDDFEIGGPVGDKADDLYTPVVIAPLVDAASRLSQATPQEHSTSRPTSSPASRPKRSRQSSTTPTPTVVTETTSS